MKFARALLISTALLSAFLILSSLISVAQTNPVRARVTQPVDVRNLVTLHGNVHPLARAEFDQGVAPDDLPMERMLLVLQRGPEQEAALRQLLDDQQVKSSPRFHQWLTPEEFGQQFGPADSDFQAVTDWLGSQGFQVAKVSAGRTVIEFSGTAGLVRQVLGTEIHKFRVNGEDHWANVTDPQIPAALAPVVAGFASLNNFPRQHANRTVNAFSRSQATGEVRALFTVSSNGTNSYALGPADFATIYNVLPLWNAGLDGTGQTIAIVAETNINIQDVRDFRNVFGLPAKDPQIILNGPDPGIKDDEMEADIDVEWSGAVAKGATIDLVVSETTEATMGIDLSALYIIDNNLAPVMSESYGECEQFLGAGGNAFYYVSREQGAAQGITIINSSGDAGSARCDQEDSGVAAENGLAVSGMASTPFNVAVGGTDFDDFNNWSQYWNSTNSSPSLASAKSYIPETTWNSSCAASGESSNCANASTDTPAGIDKLAGGGGPSTCGVLTGTDPNATCVSGYSKPAWQTGAGVPNDGVRDIPDVSLFASTGTNHSFYALCEADALPIGYVSCNPFGGSWYFVEAGGTSVAAPDFAGIMALVNQKTGVRQGNANYVLYPLAAQPGATCTSNAAAVGNANCIFYDVVSGSNSVACVAGSKNCSNQSGIGYGILVNYADNSTPAWTTTSGYDLATGIGSVNAENLVNKWTSVTFNPTTTTLSTFPQTITHGQPVRFTVTVASGSGTPTGDISLKAQTSVTQSVGIGSFALGSGGTFSGTTDMLPGGSYNVGAHYAGDGTHGASDSAPQPVTVGKENSQTKVGLAWCDYTSGTCNYGVSSMAYGSSYGFFLLRTDVTDAGGQPCASPTTGLIALPCPTGTVTVASNGQPPSDLGNPAGSNPGTYILNSQGYAEDRFIQVLGGTSSFVASYAGDNSYTASTSSPTVPITVTKAPTTTTLTGLPSSSVGGAVSLTVTVSTQSYGAAPTGKAQFLSNGVPIGPAYYLYNGTPFSPSTKAFATISGLIGITLPAGTDTITVQYSGDNAYAGSTSAPATIAVIDYTLTANPSSINIPAPGQFGTSTITLTPTNGFTGAIALSCSPAEGGVTCAILPTSVNITTSSAVTATLTVSTVAPVTALVPPPTRKTPSSYRLPVGWSWGLAGLLALVAFMGLASGRRRLAGLLLAGSLVIVGIWAACGGTGAGGGGSSSTLTASISPTSLIFDPEYIGSTSGIEVAMLSNAGNATLTTSGVTIAGANPGDFAQTNACGTSIQVSSICAYNVTFTPTAAGSRSASLSITDNASGSPHTVSLTGTGLALTTTVSLSRSSLTFGQENMGSATAPQIVTLSNTGNSLLNITNIVANAGFIQNNNCGSSVPVGANCTINVTFNPFVTGAVQTTLGIWDNAIGNPQTVSLSGTGMPEATMPGTYPVDVFASGSTNLHSVQLSVTVQ